MTLRRTASVALGTIAVFPLAGAVLCVMQNDPYKFTLNAIAFAVFVFASAKVWQDL